MAGQQGGDPFTAKDREREVALAIGRVIWGAEVEPKKNWLKAARAAMAVMRGERPEGSI